MTTTNDAHLSALILRLTTGVLFLAHGLTKVLLFTIPGTVGYFESLGLPGALAYLTIIAEIGGGIALILGVATRMVSLALLPVLLGAVWVHAGNGWMFANEGGGWEFPLFWAMAQVTLVFLGNGAYAVKLPYINQVFGKYA